MLPHKNTYVSLSYLKDKVNLSTYNTFKFFSDYTILTSSYRTMVCFLIISFHSNFTCVACFLYLEHLNPSLFILRTPNLKVLQ